MSDVTFNIDSDADQVASRVADLLVERLSAVQAEGRVPSVVLTGGSIAEKVHRALAQSGGDVDWSRVEIWWGDERYVAADDVDRNERQTRSALLDHVDVDPVRVHPMPASDASEDIGQAAAAYADDLARVRADSGDDAMFDVVMLGIGGNGHVASLFPGKETLHVTGRSVVTETDSPKPPPRRLSMTYEILNRGTELWMIAAGESKAEAVSRAVAGDPVEEIPASGVHGLRRTIWFLDAAAANRLDRAAD